jgi:hypothetical protein
MKQIDPVEAKREYFYHDGTSVAFINVTALDVTKSGFHKLEADGKKVIVAPGWRYVALDVAAWSF